jgi:hypothetical protein
MFQKDPERSLLLRTITGTFYPLVRTAFRSAI